MQINDQYIIDLIWPGKMCKFGFVKHLLTKDIIEYIDNRYNDSESIKETLYRIKYNIEERPVCPKCGKPVKFGAGFNMYCSRNCAINQEKIKKSIKEKYGVDNISQLDYVKQRKIETTMKHYGVTNPYCLSKCVNKSKETRKLHKDKWINKIKKTNLEKYEVENVAQNKLIKERAKHTNLQKYGQTSWTKTDEGKVKLSKIVSSKEVQQKTYKTKKANNTFNSSKTEYQTYILLKEKYPNTINQYRSDIYPFNCDFYIPEIDTYIECNYHWTHGHKPYEGTDEDKLIVKNWKAKSTKYYDNAVNTWTISDVNKRNIARQNKINWLEFFSILKLKEWLDNGI